jgi:hypothetical protein
MDQSIKTSCTYVQYFDIETIFPILSHSPCVPVWPDWAKIRPMGDCLLLAVFKKEKGSPILLGYFFLCTDDV